MTKQYELKKCAYASALKSRPLSVLIYLIDRSNKELTCFPAIPTMARELHISVSTVKRALHELVEAGFIVKESRFREQNHGQTSNLYTLVFSDGNINLDNDYTQQIADDIDAENNAERSCPVAEQITFEGISQEEAVLSREEVSPIPKEKSTVQQMPPVHSFNSAKNMQAVLLETTTFAFLPKLNYTLTFSSWTGVGVSLHPP